MNSFKLGKYKFIKDLTEEYPNHHIFLPTIKIHLFYDGKIYYLRYLWDHRKNHKIKFSKKHLRLSIQPSDLPEDTGVIETISVREFSDVCSILTEQEIKKVTLLL